MRYGPAIVLAGLVGATGCDPLRADLPARLGDPSEAALPAPPATAAEFLAELSPLPAAAVLVVYDINGPGGLSGSLEVMLAAGARRRENWSVSVDVEGEPVHVTGSTIQNAHAIATDGPHGRSVEAVPLAVLADAWVAADLDTRAGAVATLRSLHAEVAASDASLATETIQGVACRPMRIASQELCMWDAAGLPLRYRGDAFELRAVRIDLDPQIGAHAFEIDAVPARATVPKGFDPAAAIEALAAGSYGDLGPWLHPGLRLPGPRDAA